MGADWGPGLHQEGLECLREGGDRVRKTLGGALGPPRGSLGEPLGKPGRAQGVARERQGKPEGGLGGQGVQGPAGARGWGQGRGSRLKAPSVRVLNKL